MTAGFADWPTIPLDALFDDSRVHPNTAGELWQQLLAAEIVVAVDRTTQQEFLVSGREILQQFLASGEPREASFFRIELDMATDDPERLRAIMLLAKGRCGSRRPGQNYSLGRPLGCGGVELICDDGSTGVVTSTTDPYLQEARAADDARLREIVEEWRARGVGRPVIVFVQDGFPARIQIPPTAAAYVLTVPGGQTAHVMTTRQAREALRPFFPSRAKSLFRVPRWELSYWSVYLDASGSIEVLESLFWADVPESERPQATDPG